MQNKIIKLFGLGFLITLSYSCATLKAQYTNENEKTLKQPSSGEIDHTFYLVGNTGFSKNGVKSNVLDHLNENLISADKNSTVIFLGDNVHPKGLVGNSNKNVSLAENNLQSQLDILKDFKGQTYFIPGELDWNAKGLKGLERQEDFIDDAIGKNTFQPEHGCPIETESISDDIELIIIDSKWYLTNWDKHPTMNDECQIKTRESFFEEFESEIKKARGKTTIVAIHHPMFGNGPHNGQYSLKQHLLPLPLVGTIKNVLRKTTGVNPNDFQNKRYNELRNRIISLAQSNERVVFVSGHENSLQYLEKDNLKQIISGSASKKSPTRNVGGGLFSYGENGFSKLTVYKDGTSDVSFFASDKKEVVYSKQIFEDYKQLTNPEYKTSLPKTTQASIYDVEETDKSGFYKFLMGDRHRLDYSQKIKAPVVYLDTLMGGLTPVRMGGGRQSKSLRLKNNQGQEFVMRGLRKSAVKYIQAVGFKQQYVEGQFEDTYVEDFVLDVFSGSHPYAPFAVGNLSDPINLYHTNPKIYYVPKQKSIEPYNDVYGDELYMIEEHAGDNHDDQASFGYSDELISTYDMLEEIRSDEDVTVDETMYIRARLFDMLIGDWDRHQDQWRWAKFKKNGKTIYRPFPRDRDQAFSIMSDGLLFGLGTSLIPILKPLKAYNGDISNIKMFNNSGFALDMTLISSANKEVWDAQVQNIVSNLTDEVIDSAFSANMPEEINQQSIEKIKKDLKERRKNLQRFSDDYFQILNKIMIIQGTDKDDWFSIERKPNGITKVTAYRIKDGEKADVFHQQEYNHNTTKEIWVYALDDDDVFHLTGDGNNLIKLRLIGGQNNDIYDVENGKKVVSYDFKSKPNTFKSKKGRVKLLDDYETNIYNLHKPKNNTTQLLPVAGFNPDDGLKLGASATFTNYGFVRNPFSAQHQISAAYYFATNGFELNYNGEFANVIGRWNLGLEAAYTSPNYAINFFGYGNETSNPEVELSGFDLDYNRVKLGTIKFAPSLIKRGQLGSEVKLELNFQSIEVQKTDDRFIDQFYVFNNQENKNDFVGAEISYYYKNVDLKSFPTLGFTADFSAGYTRNIETTADFGYVIPSFGIDYNIIPSGQLVLATKLKGHITIGDEFEFYQAASIGASDGLRGFRNQRFTGKHAYYQITDLRYMFGKLKNGILPLNVGVYGGFDYGRVWLENDNSDMWHTSYGGGLLMTAAEMLTLNLSLFTGSDDPRFAFGMGLRF